MIMGKTINELHYTDSDWIPASNGEELFVDVILIGSLSEWVDEFHIEMQRFGLETLAEVFNYVEKDWKPQSDRKILAVNYTARSGEYEFCGTTIVYGNKDENDEDIVHAYFKGFYEDLEEDEMTKASSYLYCAGEVAIKSIGWTEITEEERAVLNKIGIH